MIQQQTLNQTQVIELLKELGQSHIVESFSNHTQEEVDTFVAQINKINQNYPGGISEYVVRAKQLLKDSYNEVNPYEGYTPFVPAGENVSFYDTEQIHKLESIGAAEIAQTCFVLVAGGLGERLGYEGIKVGIPIELVTRTTFLEYYVSFILAYEKRFSPDKPLPFAIMTSDDTHSLTLKLLQDNLYFGMKREQITLIKQEKIPAMVDNEARFNLLPGKLYLDTKPHGHGDIHTLLYMSGLSNKWAQEGRQWLFIFQDTNPLSFRALPSVLGVSKIRGFELNSITVPRKPGEACGAICELRHHNGSQITINVEYNQLGPLMQTIGGEPTDEQGYSKFPGNINALLFALPQYNVILQETKGLIAEFINPKYADSTKTKFKSATRLECMMQDYPKLLKSENKVGITQLDRRFCFTTVKNDLVTASQKQQQQLALECAGSCESDFFWVNSELLRLAGAEFYGESNDYTFGAIKYNFGPKVVLHPSFGVTLKEIQEKIQGQLRINNQSTLVIGGNAILKNIQVDGVLKIQGNGVFENIVIDDKRYQQYEQATNNDVPPHIKIRNYFLNN